jgi:hypothetical protein
MRPSDRAWVALAGAVLVYEIAAGEDELLSNAADRWMLTHPWTTRLGVAAVALHLANAVPERLDPLHWLFSVKRLLRR